MKKIFACPGWLDLSEDRRSFILVAEKAEIVRRIFQLSIGGLGSYSIAKQLDRQNIPAFGKSPKWDHTTIDSLLRNRATLGEHQPKSYAGGSKKGVPVGDPIPNYYPAIIDEETFVAAQTARQIHLASGRGRKGNDLANLFTGITTCAYCGEAAKFYSNGNAKSLICARVLQGNGCIRFGWSYRNFEQSVLHFLSHPALLQNRSIDEQRELTALIQQLGKLTEPNPLDARLAIASQLKAIVSELKISAGGKDPTPTHPASLIKRDHPARFFEVRLWQGPLFRALPVP
jgi:Recombinase